MLKLSLNDVKRTYHILKKQANRAAAEGEYEKSLDLIWKCDKLAEQFNWIYSDYELENLLSRIANSTIIQIDGTFDVVKNRVIFYDDFCVSFILALQYLDALKMAGKEVVYLAFNHNSEQFDSFVERVSGYSNVKVVILPRTGKLRSSQLLYDEITKYRPEQLILHMYACSPIAPTLFVLPKAITKYNINLADQTFWLGVSALDYVLEFRQFGVSVSQQRRGVKPSQQLLIPFYPIADNNSFRGFPDEFKQKDAVIIFSGGDLYKVLDEKKMFWRLTKLIMDKYPEVVFLFATKCEGVGIEFINDFIRDNHYEKRFFYTKFRSDIDEVLSHIDIYMGTCPTSGSLMSQLAARNSKPILQYYYPGTPDDETEQAICINEECKISFNDENSFMQEADRLIKNTEYRKSQGERLHRAMISVEQFNGVVDNSLAQNKTQIPLNPYNIDYHLLEERWFSAEKAGYRDSFSFVWNLLCSEGYSYHFPSMYLKKQIRTIYSVINRRRLKK